jgi:hypothetical protein
VLGIAMMKEAMEDYKRYRQDVEVNKREVEVGGEAGGASSWGSAAICRQPVRARAPMLI